jgi:FKBP-type peptidyl-prolyl cis-trans isomerase 2
VTRPRIRPLSTVVRPGCRVRVTLHGRTVAIGVCASVTDTRLRLDVNRPHSGGWVKYDREEGYRWQRMGRPS